MTARLRFLFVAAKIVRHAGAVLVRDSDHYAEQGKMGRLMDRLREIVRAENTSHPSWPHRCAVKGHRA